MAARRLHARFSTPSAPAVSGSDSRPSLPQDVLQQASRRLAIVSLVGLGLWLVNLFVFRVVPRLIGWTGRDLNPNPGEMNVIVVIMVAVSLALFFVARTPRKDCSLTLNLGLGYEVLTAAAIGYINHWVIITPGDEHGVSWVAVIILLFAALLPTLPRYTAIAALTAALMDPLFYLAWLAQHGEVHAMGSAIGTAFFLHAPNFMCVGIALVISQIYTGLGHQVKKARDLGSYELADLLGSGGMGEVWRANHRLLARPAAIKLIRAEKLGAADPEAAHMVQARFRREAQAAASLRSPHTIELFDFGISQDGTFYYVMELLDGLDLDQLVRRFGPLEPARAIAILLQACDSLGEAHQLGLTHRDIKPANIYLCRMGLQHDYVKVLDFGLVKSAEGSREQSMLTAPNSTAGTPAFMPPEMALGEAVDGRTDLYALGCVAYWLLTGRLVFESDNSIQMIAHHVRTPPVPPSQKSEFPIPAELDAAILACLAKAPADRPATAQHLVRRLAAIGLPGTWDGDRAAHWWDAHLPAVPS
ncbi:MAG TPA: serine/threonine-protein kinase [Gemmatimonadales bacterium]|nr:serine/threonine-protein kinase [Gemmatimonadales bacterium]